MQTHNGTILITPHAYTRDKVIGFGFNSVQKLIPERFNVLDDSDSCFSASMHNISLISQFSMHGAHLAKSVSTHKSLLGILKQMS